MDRIFQRSRRSLRDLSPSFRRIILALFLLLSLITIGTLLYMTVEKMNFMDAIYMTIITISTVGFREVVELDTKGRLITMFLILSGVGLMFYTLGTAIEYFFGDFFETSIRERRQARLMKNLKSHYIVCGYGRVGKEVCRELKKTGKEIVVIEIDPEKHLNAEKDGFFAMHANANDENVLRQAGIERASGIAACVGDDPDNVFITLTARSMAPDIFIVARANEPEVEKKLYRAGANRVINPSTIGGKRIAMLLAHPKISEYLDILSFGEDIEFELEQYEVKTNTELAGKTIGELKIRDLTGAMIILVRHSDGSVETAPGSTTKLDPGSRVIVLGTREQLDSFEKRYLT